MNKGTGKENYRFSIVRLIWIDYPAYNAALFPVVLWGITGLLVLLDYRTASRLTVERTISGSTQALFYIAILMSLVCIPLILIRLRLFWRIWREGLEIQGKITQTLFQRDRGQIFFTYQHKNYVYNARIVVHKTKMTTALKKDQPVALVILPQDPKQVFIRDFYLEVKR